MVFEKELRKGCVICGGVHIEEHEAHKMTHPIVRLTWTGKILPAIMLVAIFLLIFAYTLSYAGIEFPYGMYNATLSNFNNFLS